MRKRTMKIKRGTVIYADRHTHASIGRPHTNNALSRGMGDSQNWTSTYTHDSKKRGGVTTVQLTLGHRPSTGSERSEREAQ